MVDRVGFMHRSVVRIFQKYSLVAGGVLLFVAVAIRFIFHYAVPYFRFDPVYFGDFLAASNTSYIPYLEWHPGFELWSFSVWTGLRHRAMAFHVWTGRLYLVGVAVGSTGAFMVSIFTTPKSFGVSLMFLAAAWIVATGFAYGAILRGMVTLHKEWMVRS